MEPVWPTGQSKVFVDRFLEMMERAPAQALAYAQIGQENSFGWPMMRMAYPMQMEKAGANTREERTDCRDDGRDGAPLSARLQVDAHAGAGHAAGSAGQRSSRAHRLVPQSRFLRANLHFRGSDFYMRDLHVYNDRYPQPFLTEPVRVHGIDQRMLAVLDGYHWSDGMLGPGHAGKRATGRFILLRQDGTEAPLMMDGLPVVEEDKFSLRTRVPLKGGGSLSVLFKEREIEFRLLKEPAQARLLVRFEWNAERSALKQVFPGRLDYRFRDFDYAVSIAEGAASRTARGVDVVGAKHAGFRILMAQPCC